MRPKRRDCIFCVQGREKPEIAEDNIGHAYFFISNSHKMKKLILIAAMAFACLLSKAQNKDTLGMNIPLTEGHLIYQGVVNVNGLSKNDLLNNCKQWFVDYFKSSKDVIQNEDRDQGRVIGKGFATISTTLYWGMRGYFYDNMTIQIDCKDNKYRYKIYSMVLTPQDDHREILAESMVYKILGNGKCFLNKSQCQRLLMQLGLETNNIIASLNKSMLTKSQDF